MTLIKEPCTRQDLIAYHEFGGIADKCKLLKDGADELFIEVFEREASEATDRERNRLRRDASGLAVLRNPPSPSSGAGTCATGNVQWSDEPGKLIPARDRRIL